MWVYPEMHLIPSNAGSYRDRLTRLDSVEVEGLGHLARELGIWLVPGTVYELTDDDRVYNTALVFNPDGEQVAKYRKMFPWRPVEQSARGVEFELFDIPGYGRVGLSICYDIWFPEHSRHLAWYGADLILNVVLTNTTDRDQELAIVRGNAIMNQVWIASVNASMPDGRGRSLVVDPNGNLQASSPDASPEVLTVAIDFDRVEEVRAHGTAGVTYPWAQYRDGDPVVSLPLYNGHIQFDRWAPSKERYAQ